MVGMVITKSLENAIPKFCILALYAKFPGKSIGIFQKTKLWKRDWIESSMATSELRVKLNSHEGRKKHMKQNQMPIR